MTVGVEESRVHLEDGGRDHEPGNKGVYNPESLIRVIFGRTGGYILIR